MSCHYACSRLVSLKKLADKDCIRRLFNYRSLTSCASLNPSYSSSREIKTTKYDAKRYIYCNPLRCYKIDEKSSSEDNISISASVIYGESSYNSDKNVQESNDIDEGLLELEDLSENELKVFPSVAVCKENLSEDLAGNTTTFTLPRSGNKAYELYGTPDPTQPASNEPCQGCGALLHCKDSGVPGYLPSQAYLSIPRKHLKGCLCQRCLLLKNHQIALDLTVPLDHYDPIIREIKNHDALVVLLVDMTDLSNSFHETFKNFLNSKYPVFVIGNKIDLLPKDHEDYLERAYDCLRDVADEHGFNKENNVQHFSMVSAKTGFGIEALITKLLEGWRLKGNVYILGCANSGKSTLFNSLLVSDYCRSTAKEVLKKATTSVWPGTTLNLLKFPIINPKPDNLQKRMKRLSQQSELSEYKLERSKKFTQKPSLQGVIGNTFMSHKDTAIIKGTQEGVGFLAPSYSYQDTKEGGQLVETEGRDGAMNYLGLKHYDYDDSKFSFWCYDTPGLINPDQIINTLNQSELLECVPKDGIQARSFFMRPGDTMFVSGLSRIDFCKGYGYMGLTVFTSVNVPVMVVKTEEADQFYKENLGTKTFGIPIGDEERLKSIPPLVGHDFVVTGRGNETSADIVLSSLGWVAVNMKLDKTAKLRAYTPGGKGCKLRSTPILHYATVFKGTRVAGTNEYARRKEIEPK